MELCVPPFDAGVMLKEAVDDLEWAATGGAATQRGTCQLRLGRHPRSLVLRASGAGSLEVLIHPPTSLSPVLHTQTPYLTHPATHLQHPCT